MPHLPACKITTFTFMKIIKETIKGVQDVLWVNKWFWVVLKKWGFVLFDKYVSWIFIKPLPCSSKFLQICKKKNTIFAFLLEPYEQLVPAILGGLPDQEPGYKTNRFRLLKFQFQDRYSKYSMRRVLCCRERIKEALTNSWHPVFAAHHDGQRRLSYKQIILTLQQVARLIIR